MRVDSNLLSLSRASGQTQLAERASRVRVVRVVRGDACVCVRALLRRLRGCGIVAKNALAQRLVGSAWLERSRPSRTDGGARRLFADASAATQRRRRRRRATRDARAERRLLRRRLAKFRLFCACAECGHDAQRPLSAGGTHGQCNANACGGAAARRSTAGCVALRLRRRERRARRDVEFCFAVVAWRSLSGDAAVVAPRDVGICRYLSLLFELG